MYLVKELDMKIWKLSDDYIYVNLTNWFPPPIGTNSYDTVVY